MKNSRLSKVEDLDPILKHLVEHRYIRTKVGGKKEEYEVNPLWDRQACED